MITLYINPTCPFCIKVTEVAEELGVPFTLKDIHDPGVAAELIEKGGKRQMPFMIDDSYGISMYESMDIMQYLHEHYASHSNVS